MSRFILVFLTSFFLSVGYGVTIYVNSTFLEQFFSREIVGSLFALSALGNILLFFSTPRLLRKFRKESLLLFFLLTTLIGTFGLALSNTTFLSGLFFLLTTSILYMNYYCLDIALEELSSNKHTGSIRGLYWTFLNSGIMLGPLLVSFLVDSDSLKPVYLVSSLALAVAMICALFLYFLPWSDIHHKYHQALQLPLKTWWQKRNLRAVTLARLTLEIFFSIMTVYTTIYLHSKLGFTWSELGVIFAVMLLPFVVLEWPVGEIADHFWGEKEMMTTGFLLIGLMLLLMPFLHKSFLVWLLVLLVSRIGASLVEITTESYFFKKVSSEETGLIGIFRLARPISFIIGVLIGIITLRFLPFETIFLVTAVVVFLGMKESLHLKDTL